MKVLNRISNFREKFGYSERELADLIGLSVLHVVAFESFRVTPSLDVAFRLMHVFNCSFEDLFYI